MTSNNTTQSLLSQQQIATLLNQLDESNSQILAMTELLHSTEHKLEQEIQRVSELEMQLLAQQQTSDLETVNESLKNKLDESNIQISSMTELLTFNQQKLEQVTERVNELENENELLLKALADKASTETQLHQQLDVMRVILD